MLILTRRTGETVCIGENIEITVMEIGRTQARLGISAPRTVVVDRAEIAERKRRERERGESPAPNPAPFPSATRNPPNH